MTYQLKLLTTALCSVLMLGKKLSSLQWVALLVLFSGVAIVQYDEPSTNHKKTKYLGLFAVVVCTFLSAFASVYFEKILKNTQKSLWLLNVQLATIGIFFSSLTILLKDSTKINQHGFFFGYDLLASSIIFIQAFGGFTVAVVIKYADNILKGFATSGAIIISCIVSMFLFHVQLSLQFCLGASLVIVATYIYSKFPTKLS